MPVGWRMDGVGARYGGWTRRGVKATPALAAIEPRPQCPIPPLLGWVGVPCRGCERSKPRVRVAAVPRPPHNETPLLDTERGGEPGTLWVHEPG